MNSDRTIIDGRFKLSNLKDKGGFGSVYNAIDLTN